MSSVPSPAATTLFETHWESIKHQSFLQLCLLESHNSASRDAKASLGVVSDQASLNQLNRVPALFRSNASLIQTFANNFAKTQLLTISEQLQQGGVRSLDLRVALRGSDNVPWVHHTFFIAPLAEVLMQVTDFLRAHVQEMVQVNFKWTDTQATRDLSIEIGAAMETAGLVAMAATSSSRNDSIESLVDSNRRLFVFLDRIATSPAIKPAWATGYLDEFRNKYIDSSRVSDIVADTTSQIAYAASLIPVVWSGVRLMYTIKYSVTPQSEDYIGNVKGCCGLTRSSPTLRKMNDAMPPLSTAFPMSITQLANRASIDFCQPNSKVADMLLTMPLPNRRRD